MTTEDGKIADYVGEVPSDIRRAINGLASEEQIATMVALIKNNGSPFSELQNELGVHQQTLSRALNGMQSGGLVARKESIDSGRRYKTEYVATEFGKRFLDCLYDSIQPAGGATAHSAVYSELDETDDARKFYDMQDDKQTVSTTTTDRALIIDGPGRAGGSPGSPVNAEPPR